MYQDKPAIVSSVNTYLFHILYSRKTEKRNEKFKKFFETMARIKGNDEAKVFLSLHQYLDPALVDPIVVTKIPGMTQKIINCLETLFSSKWITWIQDMVTEKEWLSDLIATIFTMAKIIASFADLFKDTFLAVTLITILGGPLEVLTAHLPYPVHLGHCNGTDRLHHPAPDCQQSPSCYQQP